MIILVKTDNRANNVTKEELKNPYLELMERQLEILDSRIKKVKKELDLATDIANIEELPGVTIKKHLNKAIEELDARYVDLIRFENSKRKNYREYIAALALDQLEENIAREQSESHCDCGGHAEHHGEHKCGCGGNCGNHGEHHGEHKCSCGKHTGDKSLNDIQQRIIKFSQESGLIGDNLTEFFNILREINPDILGGNKNGR